MQAFIVFQQAYLAFCLSRFLYVIDNYVEDLLLCQQAVKMNKCLVFSFEHCLCTVLLLITGKGSQESARTRQVRMSCRGREKERL